MSKQDLEGRLDRAIRRAGQRRRANLKPGPDCPPDAQIDHLVWGKLSDADAGKIRVHMAACDYCKARGLAAAERVLEIEEVTQNFTKDEIAELVDRYTAWVNGRLGKIQKRLEPPHPMHNKKPARRESSEQESKPKRKRA